MLTAKVGYKSENNLNYSLILYSLSRPPVGHVERVVEQCQTKEEVGVVDFQENLPPIAVHVRHLHQVCGGIHPVQTVF